MTLAPRLSVVVATHGGAHRLRPLLAQLAAQDIAQPWEVVAVVDGVVDATRELLDAWRHRLPLRVLVNEDAQGVAFALHRGFAAARGEYLLRCDDDLDIPGQLLSGHLAAQDGRADRVVLSLTRDLFAPGPYARAYGRPANERALRAAYAQPPEFRWQHVAACFSLHRDAWEASGGFDPRFAYGEDSEFGYRLWRAGCELIAPPALEVGHRGPAASAATRVPRAFVSGASRRLFARAHPEAERPAASPGTWRSRLWTALVGVPARLVRTPAGFRRLGAAADVVLRVAPPALGGRLVALLVEASGRSGLAHGSADLHSYRGQKDAELLRERRRKPSAGPPIG